MTTALIQYAQRSCFSLSLCFTPCYGTTCHTQLPKFMSANVQIRGLQRTVISEVKHSSFLIFIGFFCTPLPRHVSSLNSGALLFSNVDSGHHNIPDNWPFPTNSIFKYFQDMGNENICVFLVSFPLTQTNLWSPELVGEIDVNSQRKIRQDKHIWPFRKGRWEGPPPGWQGERRGIQLGP